MTGAVLALRLSAALAATSPFTVETLAPGVELYRGDPHRGYANSLVVERADGLAIVDAQPSPAAATELLAAIAARTDKRPRYLILSHPHVEAIGGAAAFPETATRIGSAGCLLALRDPEFDFALEARTRAQAANPAEYRPPAPLAPVLVLEGPASLEDPVHSIRLYPLPPADTDGDLLVAIPDAGIVFVGDLLAWEGNPFPGHASIDGWIARINAVATMAPKVVVPARGPAGDANALRRLRDGFLWLRGQIAKSFVDLVPVAEMPDRVMAHPDFAKWFDPAVKPSFIRAVIAAVLREAETERRRRGLP